MTTENDRTRRRAPTTRLPILVLLLGALAGCSSAGATGAPTPTALASATGSPSSTPLASPLPAASAVASPVASAGFTVDGSGDVTPSYLDIVAMRAGAESGSLTLALDLAGAVPAGNPSVGQLAYVFYVDVDGDGAWDYTATFKLVPEGGYRPSLATRAGGAGREGPDFPGTAALAGSTVSLTLRLDAIGCPASVGVRAASQQTKAGATAGDTVPDASDAWIPVTTDCQPAGS